MAGGATRVSLPLYRREHAGGLSTGIQVMNLGSDAAHIQIRFVRQYDDGRTESVACLADCEVDVARRKLEPIARSGGEVAGEASLFLCELDLKAKPCEAKACLERLVERGGALGNGAAQLRERSRVDERCRREP